MSMVYALIARQQNVLCEYTDKGASGNFQTVTRAVLKHLAQQEAAASSSAATAPLQRSVFPYNEYNFFFLHDNGLSFMCMAEEKVHANAAFTMLTEMKALFLQQYAKQAKTAIAYSMAPFASTIESLTKKYDNYTVDTPLMQVRQKMEKVKMIMIENVDQLMQKGDKIELLVMRTQSLHKNAMKYDKAAKTLKTTYWWKSVKYWCIIMLCLALLALWASFMICGIDYSTCSSRIESKAKDVVQKGLDHVSDGVTGVADKISDGVTSGVTTVSDGVAGGVATAGDKLSNGTVG